MNQVPHTNVVGTFDNTRQAGAAVDALEAAGFDRNAIDVSVIRETGAEAEQPSEKGAGIGSLAGAGAGAIVGVGLVTGLLPATGLLAASNAATMLLATAAGTLAGTAFGAAMSGPSPSPAVAEDDSLLGRTAVTVAANGNSAEAAAMMREHGAADAQCVAR